MSNDLITSTPPGSWSGIAAIGGPDEHDDDVAVAFRVAGEVLAAHWAEYQADDSLAIAILSNFRHALELELKTAIHLMVATWRFEFDHAQPEPGLMLTAEKRASASHNLGELGGLLQQLLDSFPYFRLALRPADREVLKDLHNLDPSGQSLRYTVTYASRQLAAASRPDVIYVDVTRFAARASIACDGIADIVSRIVDIQDMQQWLGPERLLA